MSSEKSKIHLEFSGGSIALHATPTCWNLTSSTLTHITMSPVRLVTLSSVQRKLLLTSANRHILRFNRIFYRCSRWGIIPRGVLTRSLRGLFRLCRWFWARKRIRNQLFITVLHLHFHGKTQTQLTILRGSRLPPNLERQNPKEPRFLLLKHANKRNTK